MSFYRGLDQHTSHHLSNTTVLGFDEGNSRDAATARRRRRTAPSPQPQMRSWHGPIWLLIVGLAALPLSVIVGLLARSVILTNVHVLLALVVTAAGAYLRSRPRPRRSPRSRPDYATPRTANQSTTLSATS